MNHLRQIALLIIVVLFAVLSSAQEKKKVTPEIGFQTPAIQLTKKLPDIQGWKDDKTYIESIKKEGQEKAKKYLIQAKSGKELGEVQPDINWDDYKGLAGDEFDISSPTISNESNTKHIYTKDNDLYLLDTQSKQFKRLTISASVEKNPTFSKPGDWVAFTRDNNLFAIDLNSGKEYQYTTDGSDVVYSGYAAWVYFEEIFGRPTRYKAFWWSPDGKRLAFYRFDEANVPMFPIYNSDGQHGTLERTRYPKAGDPNPQVRIGIVDIASAKTTWADFNDKDEQYFGTPFWTPDGKQFWVQWMNRDQNDLKIFSIDLSSGAKKLVLEEQQTTWVDWFEDITFLKKNKGFIVKSDKDGWAHFYLHTMDGALKNRITEGKWQVNNLEYLDEDDDMLYFTARKEASTRNDFYKVRLNGKKLQRLTFGNFTHAVSLSPDASYFITTYSNFSTPSKKAICNNDGKVLRELGDSYQKDLDEYLLAKREFVEVPTPDGYKLPAIIMLPPNMEPGKKYPVLISEYGGPFSGSVMDGWQLSMSNQALATEGLILFSVDHRGSGHFGKEGAALMHRNLGKWEMNDYIEAVKWLRTQAYVDAEKICITGGSYGGYVTAMALTAGADYFPYGIANFSVTDWQLYDSHYTERYMGTPQNNPEGYKNGSVMNYVNNYKGLLRIVHGSTDDNVHFQNSLQLADTLQNLGKHFEFMVYPNERHGWGPPKSDHSRMENMRFYYENLLGKKFPEGLFKKADKKKQM